MMERRYFFVNLPNENVVHALSVALGTTSIPRYNLAKTVVGIKTTHDIITEKVKSGVPLNIIFPVGLTTEVTEEQYRTTMRGDDWQNNDENI